MSYDIFIDKFVHPFIIYVIAGTIFSYLLVQVMVRTGIAKDSRARVFAFTLPFLVPFIAYLVYRPYLLSRCEIHGHPLGSLNDWICKGSDALAVVLTPIFLLVVVMAFTKAALSIFAVRKIKNRYGYASTEDYPLVFALLARLCRKGNITMPRLIVTADKFARSFVMGSRSPVMVLSEGLLEALDEDELETVLAHELGHIARADSVLNWVIVFLRDLMFFNPLIYWVFRDLACEKENASDDIAVKLTDKPLAFAQALIKVWRISPRTGVNSIALDNFSPHPNLVGRGGLELRVRRLIDGEQIIPNASRMVYVMSLLVAGISIYLLYWAC